MRGPWRFNSWPFLTTRGGQTAGSSRNIDPLADGNNIIITMLIDDDDDKIMMIMMMMVMMMMNTV